jgi:hypothetical protein
MLAERSYDRMILLTFAACLTRRFRFALDRHNSATAFRASSLETRVRPAAASNHAGKGGSNEGKAEEKDAGRCLAFELGKRWRFFTTYAGVQTSSVLRQQSLERA